MRSVRAFHCLCHPSRKETLSRAPLSASVAGRGTFVIRTISPGISDRLRLTGPNGAAFSGAARAHSFSGRMEEVWHGQNPKLVRLCQLSTRVPREVRRDSTPPVQKRRLPNLLKVPRECPDEPARERIAAEAYTVIAKIAEREENGILQPGPDRPPALLIESVSGRTLNRQHLCLSLKIGVPISVGVACAAARKRREREIVAKILYRF